MKKNWDKRLTELEKCIKMHYMDYFLDDWLRKNYNQQPITDYFALCDIVPQEFRAACMFRGLDELRKKSP